MTNALPIRRPWPPDFPDVVIHTDVRTRDRHPGYAAAKAGDAEAALSITVHGFQSTFTDWAAKCTDLPKEVADKALAHKLPNKVEAAYRRTDFFEKRRSLMKQWADYLGNIAPAADTATAEPIPARAAA